MRVLVACEESQVVCKAFRERGHEAYSCDILDCSGGQKNWHIKGDVLTYLNQGWDLMIAHPPCTDLAVSGAKWFPEKIADGRQQKAIEFVEKLWDAPIPRIMIENPVGVLSTKSKLGKPTQIIHPFMFGEPFRKKTCIWLKNLPKLKPTNIVDEGESTTYKSGRRMPKWYADAFKLPKEERSRVRSRTFKGIADAIADQWGTFVNKEVSSK